MAIILRIDVDNPYGYENFQLKALNFLALNYGFPGVETLGYLKYLKLLLTDLEDRGIRATFFFKAKTIPRSRELRSTILERHEVGFHAVRTDNFKAFLEDFQRVNRTFEGKVTGLSKHGSGAWKGERGHTWRYDPERCIEYARRLGLRYFSGNGENPREEVKLVRGVLYYPSAFWVNRKRRAPEFTVEWLIEETQTRDIVVLFHPYEWGTNSQVRSDYEKIVSLGDKFKTFTRFT